MTSSQATMIEECAATLMAEVERLDSLECDFAAALVRAAQMDLQMRLYGGGNKDIDVLSFLQFAIEQERSVREDATRIRSRAQRSFGEI